MEENTKTYCENASGTNKTTDKKDYPIKLNKKTRASYNHRNATLYISNGKSFRNITKSIHTNVTSKTCIFDDLPIGRP